MLRISGLKTTNHYFDLLVFIIIKKYFLHYKRKDKFRWLVIKNKDCFGILMCLNEKTIKIFHNGSCIQYFTGLIDFEEWIIKGCSKQTEFLLSKTTNNVE